MENMPNGMRHRKPGLPAADTDTAQKDLEYSRAQSWRRILLLIIAITVHNIPGIGVLYNMHTFTHQMLCSFNTTRVEEGFKEKFMAIS